MRATIKSYFLSCWTLIKPSNLSYTVLFLLSSSTTLALDNPWAKVSSPTPGPARAIGSYSAGCVQGTVSLLHDQETFELMRLSRKRYFAHPQLRDFILWLAAEVQNNGYGKLMVGDIGQPRGGPTTTGHASHQIGLDVDLWFWLDSPATKRRLSPKEKETLSAPNMVNARATDVNATQFKDAQVRVLELAATHPQVERIFVNPRIKAALCRLTNNAAWLRKIRPWDGHDHHFHVRLGCPTGDTECEPQEPTEAGHGCGAELSEWFDPVAIAAKKKQDAAKEHLTPAQQLAIRLDRVPKACDVILHPPTEIIP